MRVNAFKKIECKYCGSQITVSKILFLSVLLLHQLILLAGGLTVLMGIGKFSGSIWNISGSIWVILIKMVLALLVGFSLTVPILVYVNYYLVPLKLKQNAPVTQDPPI